MTVLESTGGTAWQEYVAEACRDQAEAIYQTLLREAYEQAEPADVPLLDHLDERPRAEALARLGGALAPGRPSPVPRDLAAALGETVRRLDPMTYGEPAT